jgi:hypothetical protein
LAERRDADDAWFARPPHKGLLESRQCFGLVLPTRQSSARYHRDHGRGGEFCDTSIAGARLLAGITATA